MQPFERGPTTEVTDDVAFGPGADYRVGILQRRDQLRDGAVAASALDADGALGGCRQPRRRFQRIRDAAVHAQALQAGAGQDDGIVLAFLQLAHAGVHVTPQVGELEIGAKCFQLALKARELDMRASPYDLSSYGYDPVKIETREGRVEYEVAQREINLQSYPLRQSIIDILSKTITDAFQ